MTNDVTPPREIPGTTPGTPPRPPATHTTSHTIPPMTPKSRKKYGFCFFGPGGVSVFSIYEDFLTGKHRSSHPTKNARSLTFTTKEKGTLHSLSKIPIEGLFQKLVQKKMDFFNRAHEMTPTQTRALYIIYTGTASK